MSSLNDRCVCEEKLQASKFGKFFRLKMSVEGKVATKLSLLGDYLFDVGLDQRTLAVVESIIVGTAGLQFYWFRFNCFTSYK